jgi:SH3 domain-containing YSC84-like protein 1
MLKATSLVVLSLSISGLCFAETDKERLTAATTVLSEMKGMGDKGVPTDLIKKAACVVIIPGVKKGGFLYAGRYGRGFASCRTGTGWSAPGGMRIEGGSFGLQAGGQESDVILLVMNKKGMENLLKSKFTLGGDASIAAGPLGREAQAQTDATMRAEILSYSRARGVFGGIALDGSTLRQDSDTNKTLYGSDLSNADILSGKVKAPADAAAFLKELASVK